MAQNPKETGPVLESVFSLFWYSFLLWIVAVFFQRFSGAYWFGDYPLFGLAFAIFVVHVWLALSSGTSRFYSSIRIALPSLLLLLFLKQTSTDGVSLEALQLNFGALQLLLLLGAAIFGIVLTVPSSAEETTTRRASSGVNSPQQPPLSDGEGAFQRIVGQEHVIEPLREIARIARSGIRVGKPNAPYGVLLFLGPTGVGKTEAAVALAEAVYGRKEALIRFDMGQFADAHQANRFYGPPPGYMGSAEGGQLTRAVLKRPRSVVLLDEVEKAHPKIWDAFLPVFDEGYIVDGSNNQRVDMTRTLIVLTSNLLAGDDGLSQKNSIEIKEAVEQTGAFRPELLGRINEILVFRALNTDAIQEILKRRMDAALWSLSEQGIQLSVSAETLNGLVEEVRAAKFGVRQIDDVVRTYLRKAISEERGSKPAED